MLHNNPAAIVPPSTGDVTQLATICPIFSQFITSIPRAIIPAPTSHPITECVAETGDFVYVATLIHTAEPKSVASIIPINTLISVTALASMIPHLIVFTTSPPAIIAPLASKIAAIIIAHHIVMARDPTAGPMLFATSFAPMLRAI